MNKATVRNEYDNPPVIWVADDRTPCPSCGHLLEQQDTFNHHCGHCDTPYTILHRTIYSAFGHPIALLRQLPLIGGDDR